MFKSKFKFLKDKFIKENEVNNKKKIENLLVFLTLLIITIISINVIWGENNSEPKKEENNNLYKTLAETSDNINSNIKETDAYELEEKLEEILSKISGVGKTEVLITYSETSEVVAMYNEAYVSSTTKEEDTNGGTRTIEEIDNSKEIIFEENNGEQTPITQKIIMPKIEGAIITAEGAGNINVKTNIIRAVSAATGLSTYRIQVFQMEV